MPLPIQVHEGGGTRTHDLGIKSPLLYQLSYAPRYRESCPAAESYSVVGSADTAPRDGRHGRGEAWTATHLWLVTPGPGWDLGHIDADHEILGIHTILVVDDAGVVRRLSFRILSEAGYRVFEAGSAAEALEVIGMLHGHVDLVLVDVVMPEVNGVDLVRMIRERWGQPAILFMSAYPAEVLAREGLKDLRVQFLAKPFTRDELLGAVVRALEEARQAS